jgi:hypothetical protein
VSAPCQMLGPASVVRAVDGHWCADAADETVILHSQSAEYFGVNHVGSRIWVLLTQGLTVRELAQAMAADYGVTTDRIENDVVPFLTELVVAGLAEVVAP